ncbi:haloacid dehalogenase [Leptospira interrogans serovar Ricardi]|uniref:HAD family hydrolase n=1 Tax=Leptospira interrogans TaxID=173 RepID=UPI002159501A|nr:HAD family hydrolase [Leptospira interrogans]MCR8639700.1 haloacid dehalogenase [Leptospira interrogans serovar Ricardi]
MTLTRDFWNPELYDILMQLRPGTAAFDFDNTLIRNDFGEAVMESFLLEGVPAYKGDISLLLGENGDKALSSRYQNPDLFRSIVLTQYETIQSKFGLEASYRWSSWIFSGHSPKVLKEISKKIWNQHAINSSRYSVKIYQPMKELLDHLIENEWEIWIVTASPEEIIQSVSHLFGIPSERVLGMQLSIKEEVHSSEILEPFTYGIGKVKRLKVATGGYSDLAFGDSINDFDLLSSATKVGIFLDRGKNVIPPLSVKIQPVKNWKVLDQVFV